MLLTFPTKDLLVRKAYQEQIFDVALLIANHRSLADWSLVPLSKISVFLGPNSAGKSSVYEAFDILRMFTRTQGYSSPEIELINDATRSSNVSPAYGLSAKYPANNDDIWEYLSQVEDRIVAKFRSPSGETTSLTEACASGAFPIFGKMFSDKEFHRHLSETVYTVVFENVSASSLKIEVFLDGKLAGKWTASDGHQEIIVKSFARKFLTLNQGLNQNSLDLDEDFTFNYVYNEWSPHAPEMGPAWPSFGDPANFLYQQKSNKGFASDYSDQNFALISAVFHYPLSNLVRKYAWTFNSEPIRDLDSDWFFCELGSRPNIRDHAGLQFRDSSIKKRSSGKHILARDAIFESIAKATSPDLPSSDSLSKINDWIGGKAFLDSGYQLKVGIKICLPFKQVTEPDGSLFNLKEKFQITTEQNSSAKSKWFGVHQLDPNIEFLARIYLVDQTGRELRFSEVGTGFSQILPILTYLGISNNYVIRQPEVHLHPKLQSRVADCIVNSVSKDREEKYSGNLIVETHSEHIVLRLLRRIKDSFKDPLLHSSLTLYPNELSLIYIKPEKNRSQVFLIRVDTSGEFIDGWPDGFFDERDEDLWGQP